MQYLKILFEQLNNTQLTALEGLLSAIDAIEGTEQTDNSIAAYGKAEDFPVSEIDDIAAMLQVAYTTTLLEEENWNATWEQNFSPISIENFCYIRADFHTQPEAAYQYEIVITPKMSFGTGHHATTQLVIQQMQSLDFTNKSVFDFGTGTGILAILAEMLGATEVIATDNDKWSIENSIENVQRNDCQAVQVADTDITALNPDKQFDIILANINRHVLLAYMPQIKALLKPDGQLIISGILQEDIPVMQTSFETNHLQAVKTTTAKNWVSILLQHV